MIATISIIGDVVKNVVGDTVNLVTLVGPDGDAHEYEPIPSDSVNIAHADIIFENGLHLEHWLDKLYASQWFKGPACCCFSRGDHLGFLKIIPRKLTLTPGRM